MIKEALDNVFTNLCEAERWEKMNKINQNWGACPVFHSYHKLSNKHKGSNGEYVVEKLMEKLGHSVEPPTNTGHDRTVDGIKTEIKFSLAVSEKNMIIKDKFIINHVSIDKDWERLLFCGINPDPAWGNMKSRRNDRLPYERQRVYFMEKKHFVTYMSQPGEKVFKHQQGGQSVENDDYICTDFVGLINLPFVKRISDW